MDELRAEGGSRVNWGEGGSLFRLGREDEEIERLVIYYGKEREHEGMGGLGGVVQTLSVFNTS